MQISAIPAIWIAAATYSNAESSPSVSAHDFSVPLSMPTYTPAANKAIPDITIKMFPRPAPIQTSANPAIRSAAVINCAALESPRVSAQSCIIPLCAVYVTATPIKARPAITSSIFAVAAPIATIAIPPRITAVTTNSCTLFSPSASTQDRSCSFSLANVIPVPSSSRPEITSSRLPIDAPIATSAIPPSIRAVGTHADTLSIICCNHLLF